jgi:hypothetical protein
MSDHIILEDGRVWHAASWVLRKLYSDIAEYLRESGENQDLADWFDYKSEKCGGLMWFDVRGFTENERAVFWHAVQYALKKTLKEQSKDWPMPEFFPSYIERIRRLLRMRRSIRRREPPQFLNDYQITFPFEGKLDWQGSLSDWKNSSKE